MTLSIAAAPSRTVRRRSSRRRRRLRALLTLAMVWLALLACALVPREESDAISPRSVSTDRPVAAGGPDIDAEAAIAADARSAEAALYATGDGVP